MAILICLDPGHVKNYNRGAYNAYYEGTKMYDFALMLKEEIEEYSGMSAFLTRTSVNDNPELATRAQMAKNKNARCFLSLHSDAIGTESVNRVSVFRSLTMPNSEALGLKLMNVVVDTIGQDIPISNNTGVLTRDNGYGRDYYGVLRNVTNGSVKEAFIIEHGFHTNYKNSLWLYSNDNLRKLAKAEAKVLAEHYGYAIKKTNSNTSSSNASTVVTNANTSTNTTTTTYTKYIAVAGDSWWKIAANKLGSGLKMNELAQFNGKSITSMIRVGDVIKIPSTNKVTTVKKYVVLKGDSWWKIAKNQLGDGTRYKELAEFNGRSTDSHLIIGEVLKIPSNN